jgi:hypothetical protein
MLFFFFLVGVLGAIILCTAYFLVEVFDYLPRTAPLVFTGPRSETRECQGCGRGYHESWEEPAPLPGEEDLRGLGPCCTGAD